MHVLRKIEWFTVAWGESDLCFAKERIPLSGRSRGDGGGEPGIGRTKCLKRGIHAS